MTFKRQAGQWKLGVLGIGVTAMTILSGCGGSGGGNNFTGTGTGSTNPSSSYVKAANIQITYNGGTPSLDGKAFTFKITGNPNQTFVDQSRTGFFTDPYIFNPFYGPFQDNTAKTYKTGDTLKLYSDGDASILGDAPRVVASLASGAPGIIFIYTNEGVHSFLLNPASKTFPFKVGTPSTITAADPRLDFIPAPAAIDPTEAVNFGDKLLNALPKAQSGLTSLRGIFGWNAQGADISTIQQTSDTIYTDLLPKKNKGSEVNLALAYPVGPNELDNNYYADGSWVIVTFALDKNNKIGDIKGINVSTFASAANGAPDEWRQFKPDASVIATVQKTVTKLGLNITVGAASDTPLPSDMKPLLAKPSGVPTVNIRASDIKRAPLMPAFG